MINCSACRVYLGVTQPDNLPHKSGLIMAFSIYLSRIHPSSNKNQHSHWPERTPKRADGRSANDVNLLVHGSFPFFFFFFVFFGSFSSSFFLLFPFFVINVSVLAVDTPVSVCFYIFQMKMELFLQVENEQIIL